MGHPVLYRVGKKRVEKSFENDQKKLFWLRWRGIYLDLTALKTDTYFVYRLV